MPAMPINNTAVANIDGLLALLDAALLGAGWTSFAVMNTTTGQPAAALIGQERVYQVNGTALAPARSYVGLYRLNDAGGGNANAIGAYAFASAKPPVGISTINWPGSGPVTIVTSAPHGFASGDLVIFNGTSNTAFHTTASTATITVTGTSSFTYPNPFGIGPSQSGTGGTVFAVYNMAGFRGAGFVSGVRWNATADTDGLLAVYGMVDEFRCAFLVLQGAGAGYIQIGQSGRRHIPAAFSDTAFTTGTVTGPGPVTFTLDRASPNLCVNQMAWLVDGTSGLFERFQVTSISGTTIGGTLTKTGTYATGALFGDDPCPIHSFGRGPNHITPDRLDNTNYNGFFAWYTNGTRVDGISAQGTSQLYHMQLDTALTAAQSANDVSGYQQGRPIIFGTPGSPVSVRSNVAGTSVDLVAAWGLTAQADGDLEKTGCVVTSSYKIFATETIGASAFGVAFGPGQS